MRLPAPAARTRHTKEDAEKLAKPQLVIGKFGFGLKDAVAAVG
jgi:hypothetical protein